MQSWISTALPPVIPPILHSDLYIYRCPWCPFISTRNHLLLHLNTYINHELRDDLHTPILDEIPCWYTALQNDHPQWQSLVLREPRGRPYLARLKQVDSSRTTINSQKEPKPQAVLEPSNLLAAFRRVEYLMADVVRYCAGAPDAHHMQGLLCNLPSFHTPETEANKENQNPFPCEQRPVGIFSGEWILREANNGHATWYRVREGWNNDDWYRHGIDCVVHRYLGPMGERGMVSYCARNGYREGCVVESMEQQGREEVEGEAAVVYDFCRKVNEQSGVRKNALR